MTDIMFVCSDLLVGGTERQLLAVASGLRQRGWGVHVYSVAGAGPMQAAFAAAGLPPILPPLDRENHARGRRVLTLAAAIPHLFKTMLKLRPAIVHFMLPEAYLAGAPLALAARIPIRVMSRRSLNNYQKNGFVRAAERTLHRSLRAVLGNSRSVVGQLEEEGVPAKRLGLIYNGIDTAPFARAEAREATRQALGIAPDALVFCMVANLIPYKGHADLLEALGRIAGELPPGWRLLLAGRDDGIGAALQEQAERLGIAANIMQLGARDDVPALLAASDMGLLCSHEEGFANSILEGMAAGLPMIVTDVGGNAEAVENGVTGYVVPPHEPPRLAEAILQLAHDGDLRGRFGTAGRSFVGERFAMEACIARYDALYRALLAGGTPSDLAEIRVT